MKNVQWAVTWENAYLEFLLSALDSFGTLTPVMESPSILASKREFKYTTLSFKDSFFTWIQSLKWDSTEALQSGSRAPNDSNLAFCSCFQNHLHVILYMVCNFEVM